MSHYLPLLILSLAAGAIPGYFLRKRNHRNIWAIADLAWVGVAIVTAYFAMLSLGNLSASSDRAFYIQKLAVERDHIRLSAYGLENKHCQLSPPTKGVSVADQQRQSFCSVLRKVMFFSSLTRFSESDAKRLATEVGSFQSKYFPDGSFNLLGGLNEYARFLSLRKGELEVNPYQELADISVRFTWWFYVLMFLLAFRSGRTFAEMFRLKEENDAQPVVQTGLPKSTVAP